MYLARNNTVRWLLRQSRDLYKKPPTRTDEPPKAHDSPAPQDAPPASPNQPSDHPARAQPERFPYKFGGIKNYPADHPALDLLLPKSRPFFQIYVTLLQAVASRDSKKLEAMVEPSLVQPLLGMPSECGLLDASSPGRILYHQFSMGLGTSFTRTKESFRKQTTPDNLVTMYAPETFSPTSFLFKSDGIPLLLSVQATVISKARLGESGRGGEEAHSLTFECESKLLMKKIMEIMGMMSSMGSQLDKEVMRKLFYEEEPTWRVGNIDKFLKDRYQ